MKKALKRSLSLLLALTLVFSSAHVGLSEVDFDNLFAVKAKAATSGTTGDCTWILDGTVLTISGNGEMGDYEFSYNDLPWGTQITEVIIEEGVTNIGHCAFYGCTKLVAISLPDTIKTIGFAAFENCSNLVSFAIPDGVKVIETSTFEGCTSLKSITIPASVSGIHGFSFHNCPSLQNVFISDIGAWCEIYYVYYDDNPLYYADNLYLNGELVTNVVIPDGVTSITDYAFSCKSLTSITIPAGVTTIGTGAFNGCTNLVSISLPYTIKTIGFAAFENCLNLVSFAIPDGIETIGESVFKGCTNLKSITIPASVTSIGAQAFHNCPSLQNVFISDIGAWCEINYVYHEDNPLCYADNLYLNGELITDVVIPDGVTSIADFAFSCKSLTSITIPAGVTTIGTGAFYGCTNLTSIRIPCSVTSVGDFSFRSCSNLVSVYIDDLSAWCNIAFSIDDSNPLTNGANLYLNDTLVKNLNIPEGVTRIGDFAFDNCRSIKTVTFPSSLKSLGTGVFTDCENLESVYISSLTNWCSMDFAHNEGYIFSTSNPLYYADNLYLNDTLVTDVVIPDGVERIGNAAFVNYDNLTSVVIPEGATNIGDYAFKNCTNLESVTIPKGLENIGKHAFYNCSALSEISIPKSVVTIDSKAFYGCSNIESVYITDIASWCAIDFYNENSNPLYYADNFYVYGELATDIIIPEGVSAINEYSFYGFNNLKSIVLPTSLVKIHPYAFGACNNLSYVFYLGSQDEWENIIINSGNDYLLSNPIHFETTEHTRDDEWQIVSEHSCTEDGIKQISCTICDYVFDTQVIPATGHTASDWIIDEEPYCIEDGYKHTECTVCGETVETTNIPGAEDHDWSSTGEVVVEPTCTENGAIRYGCNNCYLPFAQYKYETIPSTGHTSSDWIFDKYVTCTTGGSKHKECTACGEVLETVTYPATGHATGHWIIDTQATASTPGSQHKECIDCGKVVESEVIPQLKPATPKITTTNEIGGVNVTWNKVAGATKYVVFRRQGGYSTWVNVGTTTGNTLLDKNVKSGIFYVYSVRAYNSAGKYSDFVSANTNTRKFMATPKLTTIYNHVNGLAIKWNAVAGITEGYRVYRRGAGSTYWTYLGTTKNLYFIDNAVKNKSGEYFRYTVIADGGYHSKFDTAGLYLKRLANPTLNSAVSSKSGITVKWSAIKGTTGYYVYRKTANSTWVRVAAIGGTNNTTFLDKTAKKGTTYTYTVKAVYGATTSAYNTGISCYDKY